MRLVGATLVRDGADIIEAFVRHNLTVLDGLAVVDHGSCDGTAEILAALVAERLPVFVVRDESAAFDQRGLANRLVRLVFATSDADWIFPIDSDEFLKVRSRRHLEAELEKVPNSGHLVLPWLTYVPRFDADDEFLTALRSARRVAEQRHGFTKVAISRHFMATGKRLGRGNHSVEWLSASDSARPEVSRVAESAALAHVPIRSAPQFIGKVAVGWLGVLASGTLQGGESFHWREAYEHLRTGRPLDSAELRSFALNYGVPRNQWRSVVDIGLVDDPFLAEMELRYSRHSNGDPLVLVLSVVERLLMSKRGP